MEFKNKLVALIIVWDDWELAYHQVEHLTKNNMVDKVAVFYSEYSNFGEFSPEIQDWKHPKATYYKIEPDLKLKPQDNERRKRNYALDYVKISEHTHFLMTDADEMYNATEFLKEKERIFKNDISGTVCRTKVYFAHPCLTIGFDTTLVPFIHKITPNLRFEWNTRYPFAFEGPKRDIRIDPTRQMNITEGVEMVDIVMDHFSYIRKDFQKKIRNSTARVNIERSTILKDLVEAKAGYYCEFYGKTLEPCSDPYNLCSLPFITDLKA